MQKAAIYILTQNNIERKIYLKTCLYFLFKNFNSKYKYPIIILHEGDYDDNAKTEILLSIRSDCRYVINFKKIDEGDFNVPQHIDIDKMNKCINSNPVPYWRNQKYRSMCYFWIKHFFKYCKEYDYIMRLDDDSIIEENINIDVFELLEKNDLNYVSNIIHMDCSICNYEMKDFFINSFPDKKDKIQELFNDHIIDSSSEHFDKFKIFYKALKNKDYLDKDVSMSMPIMYYNNFSITRTNVWYTNEIIDMINEIDKNGNIFYCRWGDAPLQTIIMKLYDNTKLSQFIFKYSKRLQRESFKDYNNIFHNYMPSTYEKSSCITDNK